MSDAELELVKGTLDLILLKALAWGPMHGLGVLRWIETTTDRQLVVEEGALYPALHRLEVRGLLRSKWGFSNNNRRAKYYSLTEAGRQELDREASAWRRISAAIARVMKPS
jgi:transcriptional regulator